MLALSPFGDDLPGCFDGLNFLRAETTMIVNMRVTDRANTVHHAGLERWHQILSLKSRDQGREITRHGCFLSAFPERFAKSRDVPVEVVDVDCGLRRR